MKYKNLTCFLILGLMVALGATGCKKRDVGLTPLPGGGTTVGGPGPMEPIDDLPPGGYVEIGNGGIGSEGLNGEDGPYVFDPDTELLNDIGNMLEDRDMFSANTVYFGFDSSTIDFSEQEKIKIVADHLAANALHKVRIEGHCDERGTEGYNMSLGGRRAASVREYLINLGIQGDRIQPMSYGEEIPACTDATNECYALCRRGEFVLLTPRQ